MSDRQSTALVTRFAPSPTGLLHLGHAYSALLAYQAAQTNGGIFHLRIEDIDTNRCRSEFEDAIYEDLAWLGLRWVEPVRRQSEHFGDYAKALGKLTQKELLYPCFCTRKDIQQEIAQSGQAPHVGPDGHLYPGTCRNLSKDEQESRIANNQPYALRLNMAEACERAGSLIWMDCNNNEAVTAAPEIFGDVILARKDTPASYHLACTLDDHLQGVTLVVRGEDLRPATHVHRLLQALLELQTPAYRHHALITNAEGVRLAKRNQAQTIRALRGAGLSPQDLKSQAGVATN